MKSRLGRSTPRPLSKSELHHVVLKAARYRTLRSRAHLPRIERLLRKFSAKHEVAIVDQVIHHSHLHLAIQLNRREDYTRFIRAVSASIAMVVSGTGRGNPARKPFWDGRPFTRIVRGEREEANLADYFRINRLEAEGLSTEAARRNVKTWTKS